jgi:hypothetical protein
MKTYDDVLNAVCEHGAMIVRPATDEDIKQCNADFIECGMEKSLPVGYADFLKKLNGFAWNGIEFFSTDQVTDPETSFMLNDIVSANESFVEYNEGLTHCVQLGRADEDLFVYNTTNGKYEVLEMDSREVMEDYADFEAMFVGVVTPRI